MTFREDINQLRAISVLAVLFFHFQPNWLPGGFAGVDAFFVISGFLITQLIIRRVNEGRFSLLKFYSDRVNRIFPAMLALSFVLLCLGWWLFSALDYRYLGKQLVYSLTYSANYLFSAEAGYFDRASSEKLLLHTWSLAIEWQFYLLYPLLILAIWKRFNQRTGLVILFSLAVFSFSYSLYSDSSNIYFSLFSRVWELLLGALVSLLISRYSIERSLCSDRLFIYMRLIKWLALAGLILSFFLSSNAVGWPSVWTLLPVFSTAVVILCGAFSDVHFSDVQQATSRIYKGSVFLLIRIEAFIRQTLHHIGKSSYSIYVWHWPVAVLGGFYLLPYWRWWSLPVSLVLGYSSFKLVESLPRKIPGGQLVSSVYFIAISAFLVSVAGAIWYSNGVLDRFNVQERLINESALEAIDNRDLERTERELSELDGISMPMVKGSSDRKILFIGASHVSQMYEYVVVNNTFYQAWFLVKPGCFFLSDELSGKNSCSYLQQYRHLLETQNFERVVVSLYCIYCGISGSKDVYKRRIDERAEWLDEFLEFAKSHTDRVFLVKGELFGSAMDPVKSTRRTLPDFILRPDIESHYHWHERAFEQLKNLEGVTVIDPLDFLCSGSKCSTRSEEGDFLHFDESHMRPEYIRQRMIYLQEILDPS